jgi:3-deoxy-D-manno-octulosonic-acid transferase
MKRLREGQTDGYTSNLRGVFAPTATTFAFVYQLYTVLVLVAFVVGAPWFAWKALRYRKYVGSLGQRLGFLPISVNIDAEPSIWVHAVSVGEVLTTRALVEDLKQAYPHLRLFLSTTTDTGQQLARTRVPQADGTFYCPFDLPWAVRRTLDRLQPVLLVMVETEIWPTLLRECRVRGVRTVIVNGRISARSYPRYRLARRFFARVLADVDCCCMQSQESARRIVDIGAPPSRVVVTGSLKFDSLEDRLPTGRGQDRVLRFFRVSEGRLVLVAASTLRGEEGPVLAAFRRLRADHPGALLILAPRHPERFADVEHLARSEGFRVVRRSDLGIDAEPRAEVVVLDTIGELARLFQVATLVFVGGSLVDAGGHNILEPAVFGKPIVFGPSMHNFAEIAASFLAAGGAVQVRSAAELTDALSTLATDPVRRASLGAAARALVEANRGARQRTLRAVQDVLPPRPRGVVRPFTRRR